MPAPARTPEEEVDNALLVHHVNGLIRSFARHPDGGWTAVMSNGQQVRMETVREAALFCWGLSSAHQATRRPVRSTRHAH